MTTDTASTRSSAKDHLDRSVTGDVDSQEIASRVERRNSRMPGTGNLQARCQLRMDDRPTLWAVGTFDVSAVNSDRFLYGGRLKRPHLHCRADAVA